MYFLAVAAAALMVAAQPPEWSPKLAAQYMDQRAKEWLAYKPAAAPGGTCASCHGQLLYALARPVLRKVLREGRNPTAYEQEIANGLSFRQRNVAGGNMFPSFNKEPLRSQGNAVEAVMAAFLMPGDPAALDRMWKHQIADEGTFPWFNLQLEPWEGPQSAFFGATLAAVAVGNATPEYRSRTAPRIKLLAAYLQREQAAQPLHNRLMLLWTGKVFLSDATKKDILQAAWNGQEQDGSWTQDSLGPWSKPLRASTNEYSTALAAYSLVRAGTSAKDPRLARTLAWLAAKQNKTHGHWTGSSMNKERDPESMTGQFMSDAATAYATLALLEAK